MNVRIRRAAAAVENGVHRGLASPFLAAAAALAAVWFLLTGQPLDGAAALLTAAGLAATWAAGYIGDDPDHAERCPVCVRRRRRPAETTVPTSAPKALTPPREDPRMAFPRFQLYPGPIDPDVFGWELKGTREDGTVVSDCHETFHADDFNADIEAALTWAEQVIGARQDWFHTRRDGFDWWEAGTA